MCPLSVALFELFTVCSAKMDEPIDGKASNRLRYTLSMSFSVMQIWYNNAYSCSFLGRFLEENEGIMETVSSFVQICSAWVWTYSIFVGLGLNLLITVLFKDVHCLLLNQVYQFNAWWHFMRLNLSWLLVKTLPFYWYFLTQVTPQHIELWTRGAPIILWPIIGRPIIGAK